MFKCLLVVATIAAVHPAFADVIDFSPLAFPGNAGTPEQHFAGVVVGDYLFSALDPASVPLIVMASGDPNNADPSGATLGLRTSGSDAGLSFSRVDGAVFQFSGFRATHLSNALTDSGSGGTLDVLFDGAPVLLSSYDINPGFQTYTMPATPVHEVRITSNNYFQIDDLVVTTAVPEASSWLYLAGGLGLFAVSRRRPWRKGGAPA